MPGWTSNLFYTLSEFYIQKKESRKERKVLRDVQVGNSNICEIQTYKNSDHIQQIQVSMSCFLERPQSSKKNSHYPSSVVVTGGAGIKKIWRILFEFCSFFWKHQLISHRWNSNIKTFWRKKNHLGILHSKFRNRKCWRRRRRKKKTCVRPLEIAIKKEAIWISHWK